MKDLLSLLLFCLLATLPIHAQEYGLINVSVCNTRAAAEYTSGQESQALLGMPVRILGRHNEWTQVQTPDDYVAWTLSGCLHPLTQQELTQWNHQPQAVVTALYGTVYSRPNRHSMPVSDVVAGNRLQLLGQKKGFYHVRYPDGREGFLPRSMAQPLDKWRQGLDHSPQAILSTAQSLLGTPYMWGGTSSKGVDCSGFVSAVLYMHDIILPRNADQQADEGERLTIDADFGNLLPGDLLFFGYRDADGSPHVIHVGFYLGNLRFIHSLGYVQQASFDPTTPDYDAYNHGRLLFAGRILPFINRTPKVITTDRALLYQ